MGPVNYSGNSNSSKEQPEKPEVTKVVSGEVQKKKKSVGAKFRETFMATDGRSALNYVVNDVLLPSARDMLFDAIAKGTGRLMYGERGGKQNMGLGNVIQNRTTYSTPVNRTFQGVSMTNVGQRMFQQTSKPSSNDGFILSNRDDAEIVIDNLNEHIEQNGVVTMYTLKKMLGLSPEHTDMKWGWENLRGAQMRQIREGWLMELPSPKPIR